MFNSNFSSLHVDRMWFIPMWCINLCVSVRTREWSYVWVCVCVVCFRCSFCAAPRNPIRYHKAIRLDKIIYASVLGNRHRVFHVNFTCVTSNEIEIWPSGKCCALLLSLLLFILSLCWLLLLSSSSSFSSSPAPPSSSSSPSSMSTLSWLIVEHVVIRITTDF